MKFRGLKALSDTIENAPSGWDSGLRVGQFDPIAKTSKFTDHSPGTLALGLFASGWTSFLVTDSLVQNLPDQAAKPVGNDPDRDVVAQARQVAPVEEGEDTAFEFDRRVGRLVEEASHLTVTLRGAVAVALSRTLLVPRASAHPGSEVALGGKGRGAGSDLGHDLLRRVGSQTGHLRQPQHRNPGEGGAAPPSLARSGPSAFPA